MVKKLCERFLPVYWCLWPFGNKLWLAAWSAPGERFGETHWQALRVTLRSGEHHSHIVAVLKYGIVHGAPKTRTVL